jgi:hypothetical protein
MAIQTANSTNLVCDVCGSIHDTQVVCVIKPSWSGPVYIEEVYWCICSECLDKVDLTA